MKWLTNQKHLNIMKLILIIIFEFSKIIQVGNNMEHFNFSVKNNPFNIKVGIKEGIVPALIQFVILAFIIIEFAVFIGSGNGLPNVMPSVSNGGETTNPNMVRLVYMIAAFIGSLVCAAVSSHLCKDEKNTVKSFWISIAGGTLLWQSVGECSWHFGLKCENEYLSFAHIENVSSLFLLVLFVFLLGYCAKSKAFNWGIGIFLFTFLINWGGHFIQIGTYPVASEWFSEESWYKCIGLSAGIPGILFSLYCIFRAAKDYKGRLFSSILFYTSVCLIFTGVRGE